MLIIEKIFLLLRVNNDKLKKKNNNTDKNPREMEEDITEKNIMIIK